jgi:DNA-binding transcriptional MerR regulator
MSAGADVTIPDKLFFRIGEVAELTEIPPYVLRYWESEFKLLRPRKNHAGQRVYRRADIELVLRIKRLLYEDRLTLEGAKKRLLQDARGRSQQLELPAPDAHTLEVLRGLRAHLEGMRRILRGQAAGGPLERRRRST